MRALGVLFTLGIGPALASACSPAPTTHCSQLEFRVHPPHPARGGLGFRGFIIDALQIAESQTGVNSKQRGAQDQLCCDRRAVAADVRLPGHDEAPAIFGGTLYRVW